MTTSAEPRILVTNRPTAEQLEQIYNLLDRCFAVGRAFFQERLDQDRAYDPATTWFAMVDDAIASTVQIFPLSIRVGQAVLKIGAIGSVGTDPNYRGMGLAHRILHAQTAYMNEADYDMSILLASKHAFYEKAGWRLIPETAYVVDKPITTCEQHDDYDIIPFEPRYLDAIRLIYEQYNQHRTYTVVRDETYWQDLMSWPEWKKADCLLLRRGDAIVAYGLIENKDTEQVFINELLYVKDAEDDVIPLFHALCKLRPHAKQIAAMLPEDHRLRAYYTQHQGQTLAIHMAMWKMINLYSTFCKLQPELEHRLHSHDLLAEQELHLALRCEAEHIYLDYKQRQLTVSRTPSLASDASRYVPITVDERSLITYLIFGYDAADATEEGVEHADLLQALFPRQQAVFYLTDKF
ncbi:GNAT family N-acetyltransferase [Paenibacillus sp. SYP-B4298]|uniref:GNAT family N-acetyltransferase n=1 Tax=Paenibacillus sp. SYP-B4298 TaxID=2996034 RepID=UPI0022DE4B8F|nr:GNAT family N-acetyltransferase [Paenibacillus sp. SYP-B4298]